MLTEYEQCLQIIKDLLQIPKRIQQIDDVTTVFPIAVVSRIIMIQLHKDNIMLLPGLTQYVWSHMD